MSAVAFDDVPEDHEMHSFVTAAIEGGFMAPRTETFFGVDEDATVCDFLGGLYLLVGGPNADAQACLELLAQYGLVDATQDLNDPLTEKYLCDLLTALGAEMTTDDPDHVVTRGELAQLFVEE